MAGIDRVKGDIQVAMDMLLGAPAFRAAGARPYRVHPVSHVQCPVRLQIDRQPDIKHLQCGRCSSAGCAFRSIDSTCSEGHAASLPSAMGPLDLQHASQVQHVRRRM